MKSWIRCFAAWLLGMMIAGSGIGAARTAFPGAVPAAGEFLTGHEGLEKAWKEGLTEVLVRCQGLVVYKLPDDLEGIRHQRFLIRLSSGQTVLIVHNIDLSKRVAKLRVGDKVRVRGEYIWNEKGGLIHKTHRDPGGEDPSGWIKHEGWIYR